MFKNTPLSVLLLTVVISLVSLPATAENRQLVETNIVAQTSDDAKSQALEKKSETLINLLAAGKYAQVLNNLDPKLQAEWTPKALQEVWNELIAETGSLQKIVKVRFLPTVSADLVFVTTKFANKTDDFIVTFNKEQQVIGIDFPKERSIEEIADKMVDDLAAGKFAQVRGYLHPFLKTDIYPQEIEQKWQQVLKITGPFEKRLKTVVRKGSKVDDVDVVVVTIKFAKTTDDMLIIFDHQKRVTGIDMVDLLNED